MKQLLIVFISLLFLVACNSNTTSNKPIAIEGSWQLLGATTIQNGDTTNSVNAATEKMIKIINATHFAFLRHDVNKGKDSTAVYSSGGGAYTLKGNQYTEQLEYCNAREWEGHSFAFTVTINGDTLLQTGVEKIDSLGINRTIVEKYKRIR